MQGAQSGERPPAGASLANRRRGAARRARLPPRSLCSQTHIPAGVLEAVRGGGRQVGRDVAAVPEVGHGAFVCVCVRAGAGVRACSHRTGRVSEEGGERLLRLRRQGFFAHTRGLSLHFSVVEPLSAMRHRSRRKLAMAATLLSAFAPRASRAGVGPMSCVRNPEGRAYGREGVFESCTASAAVGPGNPASFAWTLTPRDIADQRWDVELAVSVGTGDVDL